MTSSAPPSGAARAAGIILRVILNRISYQMLSLRGNRIKFYNKINKVLVYYNIQLCWNVGHHILHIILKIYILHNIILIKLTFLSTYHSYF